MGKAATRQPPWLDLSSVLEARWRYTPVSDAASRPDRPNPVMGLARWVSVGHVDLVTPVHSSGCWRDTATEPRSQACVCLLPEGRRARLSSVRTRAKAEDGRGTRLTISADTVSVLHSLTFVGNAGLCHQSLLPVTVTITVSSDRGQRKVQGEGARPPPCVRAGYPSSDRAICESWFAFESTLIPDCERICCFVNCVTSTAKSVSTTTLFAAWRF